MSKFNTKQPKQKTLTTNLAGGLAYKQSKKMELISVLLTSFVDDQFYRSSEETLNNLRSLVSDIEDKKFIAKSAIYARDKFGMRSITHALAGELASELSGEDWSSNFYDKIVSRVDDMAEILSYYITNKTDSEKPKFPNSIKKGFAKAFDKFDNYQLSKYKNSNKELKLVDVVNLTHPIPIDKNRESLNLLVKNKLKNTDTWESKLSQAGVEAESIEDLDRLKSEAWSDLISTNRIGYFALLRNLRNIITQSPESVKAACDMLVNEKMISNSKVLPFRFSTAHEQISKMSSNNETRMVLVALNDALNISVSNVPKLDGETLVVMDVSGSMSSLSQKQVRPSDIASLFGAILAKSNMCDVMTFSNSSNYVKYNPSDSIMSIRDSFNFSGGGTNFRSIFTKANKKYDRIIILSDMQGWIGRDNPSKEFNEYRNAYNKDVIVYSWDLAGYGTLQLPENNVFGLVGFSDKVFDIIKLMESDKKALYQEIESINL